MNKFIAKIASRLGFSPIQKRNYQGASISRLTNDWLSPVTSADQEIRASLSRLRQRCRELERNNDFVRRFLAGLESNVLGHSGVNLQMKVTENGGRPDVLANDLIEKAWREWGRSDACTVTGRMTWFDVQRLALRSTARDGDCVIRMIIDSEGFRLQLLEGDRLDINFNMDKLASGNEVRMGVEIDRFGKPVAYHLLDKHPSDVSAVQAKRERIPAEQVIHPFVTDRIAQTRGVPWMVSAMTRLQMLGAYEEAELTAARVAASKMGFLVKEQRSEGYVGDTDEAGNTLMEVEPGAIEELPMGTTFQSWNPDHPTGNYSSFVKSTLRGIAAGLGVSYNMLANDLEGVNYSSIRAGLLDEREYYKAVQRWFIDTVIAPVFSGWLETNILNGTINLPSAKMVKFNSPGIAHWMPRRWSWVDPLKDQQASILAVENHLKSKRQVVSETGGDYESVLREIKQDEELSADIGLEKPSEDKSLVGQNQNNG